MAKPKILLVDADLKSRQMLEISLKKGGFTVTSCGEGEKALQLVDTLLPDLIVADIDLAGSMDGFLFCEVLKENPEYRRIPFIFLSKRKSVEDKIRGLELGVDDYLTKPIYLKELLARVRMILEKMRQESFEQSGSDPQFQGDLSQMSVVDLLQTMEMGGKTGVVHLERGGRTARLFCRHGRIVHAVVDNLVGERAVYRALLWNDGGFRIDFRNALQTQETIQVSTQGLIMEGMRRLDELERLKEQLPPLSTYLGIDSQTILDEHPDRFPAKIENILAEFSGEKTLEEVVESLPYDDLESLEIISKLYFQGFLLEVDASSAAAAETGVGTGFGGATAGRSPAPSSAARLPGGSSTLDTQMLNLEEASRSIEEIKKRARLGASSAAPVSDAAPVAPPAPPVDTSAVAPTPPAALGELGDDTGFELAAPDWDDDGSDVNEAPEAAAMGAALPPEDRATISAELAAKATSVVHADHASARPAAGQPRIVDDPEAVAALFDLPPQISAPPPPMSPPPAAERPLPRATEETPAMPVAIQPPAKSGAVSAKSGGTGRWIAIATVLVLLAGGAIWRLQRGAIEPPADAYALTEQAEVALAEARVSDALRLAEEAIGLDGRLGRAHAARGRALAQIGRTDDAIASFGDALRSTPTLHDARLNELTLRFARGDAPGGLQADLQTLLVKLDPAGDRNVWLDATFLSARLAIAVEDWPTARRQLQTARAAAPDDMRIPTLAAKIPEPATPPPPAPAASPVATRPQINPVAKPPAAKPASVKAPAAAAAPPAPVNARRLADEGLALYRKGKLGDAEVKLRAAAAAAPDDADVLVDLGRVLVERGRDDQALEIFLRAGSLDPRNARVYVNLGSVYMFKGDRERARKAYEAYLTLVPASSKDALEIRKVMENL